MNAREWVAVTATVNVGGVLHTAVHNVPAGEYDNTPDGRGNARTMARAALEDTLREHCPTMNIREAFDRSHIDAILTTERYTAEQEDQPF